MANDCGPVSLSVPAALGDRILRRCHDEGLAADEATAIIWERQLGREGSILGTDPEETETGAPEAPEEERSP